MGKKIIIKDADFSANGFKGDVTYWQGNTPLQGKSMSTINASIRTVAIGLKLGEALNKPINCIKLAVTNAFLGRTFSIFKASVGDSVDSPFVSLKDFTVTSEDVIKGYVEVQLNESVTITNDEETIMVGVLNNISGESVSILPVYQVVSDSDRYTYYQARFTQTEITSTTNQARFLISYGYR